MSPTRALPARFTSKFALNDAGCWIWTAAHDAKGYGFFWLGTRADGRMFRAHRVAYELLVGPIPDGMHLDHLCRTPACVNPAHLEPVTPRVNSLRGVSFSAVNATKETCPAGHPYSADNTYLSPTKRNRLCRTCQAVHKRAYRVTVSA